MGRPALRGYDSNTHLDGYGDADSGAHGGYAVGDFRGLQHQAGAECAARDAVTGAAAVEVDFVVAEFFAYAGGFREVRRGSLPPNLQGYWVFPSGMEGPGDGRGHRGGWRRA